MNRTLANCPVSWGIEELDDPRNLSWDVVLDEMAEAGYKSVELGPPGFLPSDVSRLQEELNRRGLTLSAGYVMGHYGACGTAAVDLDALRATCHILSAFENTTLLVMEDMYPEREATAGVAESLSEAGWQRLFDAINLIGDVASGHFGVEIAFHPHVGTYVEFDDEIDRFFADTDTETVGLCLDTGHSAWAGVDPLKVIDRHIDRLRYLHLKDVVDARLDEARRSRFADAVEGEVFCPVGTGAVDFAGLADRLEAIGFAGGAAVEQDRLPGLREGAIEDAKTSLDYLRQVGFVK